MVPQEVAAILVFIGFLGGRFTLEPKWGPPVLIGVKGPSFGALKLQKTTSFQEYVIG